MVLFGLECLGRPEKIGPRIVVAPWIARYDRVHQGPKIARGTSNTEQTAAHVAVKTEINQLERSGTIRRTGRVG
jgi:hypothetical protein